uniref:C2H2-type domain-containing protein n=1 Tax=Soboliphyme baturini TaxID=241478 RepID=A0A183J2G3_9BILA
LLHVQSSGRHADEVWRNHGFHFERTIVPNDKVDCEDRLVIDLTPSPRTSPCVESLPHAAPHSGDMYDSYTKRMSLAPPCSLPSVSPQQQLYVAAEGCMPSHVAGTGSCFPPAGGSQILCREGLSRLILQQQYNAALARIAAAAAASSPIPSAVGVASGAGGGNQYFTTLPYPCLLTPLPSRFSSYCMPAAVGLSGSGIQDSKALNRDAGSKCNSSFIKPNLTTDDQSCAGECTNSGVSVTGTMCSGGNGRTEPGSLATATPSASVVVSRPMLVGGTKTPLVAVSSKMDDPLSLSMAMAAPGVGGRLLVHRSVPNSKAVEEHISRLISENEALLEPSPSALSSYNQHRLLPGATLLKACRSQSLVESEMSCAVSRASIVGSRSRHNKSGALTALHFQKQVQEAMKDSLNSSFVCRFCHVHFRNQESVKAHEFRCAHREFSPVRECERTSPLRSRSPSPSPSSSSSSSSLSSSDSAVVASASATAAAAAATSMRGRGDECSSEEPQHALSATCSVTTAVASCSTTPLCSSSVSTAIVKDMIENKHPLKKRILAQAENQKYAVLAIVPSSSFDSSPTTSDFTAGIDSSSPMAISPRFKRAGENALLHVSQPQSDLCAPSSSGAVPVSICPNVNSICDMQADCGTYVVASVTATSTTSSTDVQRQTLRADASPCATATATSDVASLASVQSSTCFRPYCVTVKVPHVVDMEPMRSCKRPAQVTQSTYCCLRRAIPNSSVLYHNQRSSAYAVWPQKTVNVAEAQMNVLMMAGCNMNQKRFHYKYATANKLSRQMRMTHSSYWEYSKKLQKLAVAALIPSTTSASCSLSGVLHSADAADLYASSVSCRATVDTGSSVFRSSPVSGTIVNVGSRCCSSSVSVDGSAHVSVVVQDEESTDGCRPVVKRLSATASASVAKASDKAITSVHASPAPVTDHNQNWNLNPELKLKPNLLDGSLIASPAVGGGVSTCLLQQRDDKFKEMSRACGRQISKKVRVCNGGYKTNESYTYIRGRGRGRYVCERCGIRCKKPSMLKKHIRSHLDVRPYACPQCSFSFKTKGNLTKHMKSKSHSRKCAFINSRSMTTRFCSSASYHDDCNDRSEEDDESIDTVSYSGGDADEDIEW